jgi:hypothetical protein
MISTNNYGFDKLIILTREEYSEILWKSYSEYTSHGLDTVFI